MEPATSLIMLLNLALGLAAGYIMHRADFCVAGMFRDLFLFRDATMLRALLLLILCSMVLFELGRRLGLLLFYPFPLLGPPSLMNMAGGLLFGTGMVLAGGCVVGTLFRMGSGSVTSATAFIGLLLGSGLYAELHPWWQGILNKFLFHQGDITLPQALSMEPGLILTPVMLTGGYLIIRWSRAQGWRCHSPAEGYLQPWKAAIMLAVLGFLSYLFVGMPFGITTAYAKIAAFLENLVIPDHVAELAFFQGVSLHYTAPFGNISLTGGAGPSFDALAVIQFPLVLGITLGAFFSALLLREFSIYYKIPPRQYLAALAGGTLLALGSRMTPGCNVWHLFGGLPILAMQSLLFLVGLVPGAWLGSLLLVRLILTDAHEAE